MKSTRQKYIRRRECIHARLSQVVLLPQAVVDRMMGSCLAIKRGSQMALEQNGFSRAKDVSIQLDSLLPWQICSQATKVIESPATNLIYRNPYTLPLHNLPPLDTHSVYLTRLPCFFFPVFSDSFAFHSAAMSRSHSSTAAGARGPPTTVQKMILAAMPRTFASFSE